MKPTIIIRHRKENLKKCSLTKLERSEEFLFYRYPLEKIPPIENYLLLSVDAQEELSSSDASFGLLLLDATWSYAEKMEKQLTASVSLQKRRLPLHLTTAYPRRQTGCTLPDQGLASIEALFTAFFIMGRQAVGLLDHYHWKEEFLNKNKNFFEKR